MENNEICKDCVYFEMQNENLCKKCAENDFEYYCPPTMCWYPQ